MIYEPSLLAAVIFGLFVVVTLGLSFYLGAKSRSSQGYFAAGGGIPWFVNGVAFAGDYLSAASFLGICGMIAFYGYDGFLYSANGRARKLYKRLVGSHPLSGCLELGLARLPGGSRTKDPLFDGGIRVPKRALPAER